MASNSTDPNCLVVRGLGPTFHPMDGFWGAGLAQLVADLALVGLGLVWAWIARRRIKVWLRLRVPLVPPPTPPKKARRTLRRRPGEQQLELDLSPEWGRRQPEHDQAA
jgi:hypothetical protein